jgi:peroxiredoxin Q/BCP
VYQPKKIFGKEILGTHRTTFIINPSGIITKIYRRVIPATHAETLLTDLKELKEE